ncbi:hypothetical protein KBD08_00715 [Candidatus Babeliales bacterium]|nr:hypothetical protein [Candidatus Babeliales bacterium]
MKIIYLLTVILCNGIFLAASEQHHKLTNLMVQKRFLKKREQSLLIQFYQLSSYDYDHPEADIALSKKNPVLEEVAIKIERTRRLLYAAIHDLNKAYIKPKSSYLQPLQNPKLPLLTPRKKNQK